MEMGDRRTRNISLGYTAMMSGAIASRRIRIAPFLLVGLLPFLGACSSVGAISGAVAGAATGTASVNPVVGYVVAVGVNAGVDELQKYIARQRQGAEQDVIAQAAGEMNPGQTRPWKIVHEIPMFDDEHGDMQVTRVIETPITICKEVVFTVNDGQGAKERRSYYTTDACLDGHIWRWASSEPATERWGYFQHISH
jgi:hypothetical protein